jgi:hypothetical protein
MDKYEPAACLSICQHNNNNSNTDLLTTVGVDKLRKLVGMNDQQPLHTLKRSHALSQSYTAVQTAGIAIAATVCVRDLL